MRALLNLVPIYMHSSFCPLGYTTQSKRFLLSCACLVHLVVKSSSVDHHRTLCTMVANRHHLEFLKTSHTQKKQMKKGRVGAEAPTTRAW